MLEEWRDVKGYEGHYQVSNLGNVYNVKTDKKLKITVRKNTGYCVVGLCAKGCRKQYKVHRLVAQAFIPNPNNYPVINHKDENKENNRVDNLEWCTHKYNINYGSRNQKVSKTLMGHKMFTDINILIASAHTVEAEQKRKKTLLENGSMLGDKNPFYGKHHTEETKRRLAESASKSSSSRAWVTNGKENKFVLKGEVEEYLKNGYRRGFKKWRLMA